MKARPPITDAAIRTFWAGCGREEWLGVSEEVINGAAAVEVAASPRTLAEFKVVGLGMLVEVLTWTAGVVELE
jgi:hypothetical protein